MARNDDEDDAHVLGEAKCIAATDKAIRVQIGDDTHWIPKSVVHDNSEVWKDGDEGKLIVKKWWATKNGHD